MEDTLPSLQWKVQVENHLAVEEKIVLEVQGANLGGSCSYQIQQGAFEFDNDPKACRGNDPFFGLNGIHVPLNHDCWKYTTVTRKFEST